MEIKLRLYKSEIIKAIKDETFLSGRAELAADGANSEKVYNMQAGDDITHEAKLLRSLRIGLDDLKSKLTNFVKNDGDVTGDNISDSLDGDYDYFDIILDVSTRFNKGYVQSLTTLSSSYITEYAIGLWWTAVNPAFATNYFNSALNVMASIRRCFIKIPPQKPVMLYPKSITANFTADEFSSVGDVVDLKYILEAQDDANGKYVDDIVAKTDNPKYISISSTDGGYKATLEIPIPAGETVNITLYSRHNPDTIKATVGVKGKTE